MSTLIDTPLERTVAAWWGNVDPACRRAFFAALGINVLAFGWEMTNLTLHHDDVIHLFIQDTILGHYLGRFGHGWLYYYTQNHYFMPFLQMLQGIVLMSVYGVLVAHFWGLRRTVDIAVAAAIMCVFPYMASIYQYNTTMWAYPAAHLLAALAVILAARATVAPVRCRVFHLPGGGRQRRDDLRHLAVEPASVRQRE
jgi:4-amino-4-deoxy-L-arabinose transferase-like glycosyltransferase